MGSNGEFAGRRTGSQPPATPGRHSVIAWVTVPPSGWRTLFVEEDRSEWIETKGSFAVAVVTLCFGLGAVIGFAAAFFTGVFR